MTAANMSRRMDLIEAEVSDLARLLRNNLGFHDNAKDKNENAKGLVLDRAGRIAESLVNLMTSVALDRAS